MSKIGKARKKREESSQGWPAVVYFALFGGILLGYVIGRIALNGYPHPWHWLSAVAGGAAGFLAGWIWYRARGDIV